MPDSAEASHRTGYIVMRETIITQEQPEVVGWGRDLEPRRLPMGRRAAAARVPLTNNAAYRGVAHRLAPPAPFPPSHENQGCAYSDLPSYRCHLALEAALECTTAASAFEMVRVKCKRE